MIGTKSYECVNKSNSLKTIVVRIVLWNSKTWRWNR